MSYTTPIITKLTKELDKNNIKYTVIESQEPEVEDDMIDLDNKYYYTISDNKYVLWKVVSITGHRAIGEYTLPINAVDAYKKCIKTNELRSVKVTYENGDVVDISMAAHLTDIEIYDYFKPGKQFNVGVGPNDNMQTVAKCEILEKIININKNKFTMITTINEYKKVFENNDKFTDVHQDDDNNTLGNCTKCGSKNCLIDGHVCYDTNGKMENKIIKTNENMFGKPALLPSNITDWLKNTASSEQASAAKKIAIWVKNAGNRICGGTTIGKSPQTLVLDIKYQASEIYINDNGEIKFQGTVITSPKQFKEEFEKYKRSSDELKKYFKITEAVESELTIGNIYKIYDDANNGAIMHSTAMYKGKTDKGYEFELRSGAPGRMIYLDNLENYSFSPGYVKKM